MKNERNLQLWVLVVSFGLFMVAILNACTKQADVVNPAFPSAITGTNSTTATTSQAQIALGKALFWDPILSGGKDVACATCHHPANAYTDGIDLSLGANAVGYGAARRFLLPNDVTRTKRNSPTILNTAYNGMDANGGFNPAAAPMFWELPALCLEENATGPLTT